MNMEKLNVVFTYISIFLIIAFLSSATYAFLDIEKDKIEEFNEEINKNLIINYEDTSNVSMVNFDKDDTIIKKFSIKNNGDKEEYYDIKFDDVTNNFDVKEDLVYDLKSLNAAYISSKIVPSNDENIVSNVKINSKETHEYILTIKLNDNENENVNINKTFSSKIKIINTKDVISYSKGHLGYEIVNNSISSFKNNNELMSDGVYFTNNSINGKTIYFYRGSNNLNNNVVFGKYCYKIIRTTEDGGIRVIYNGEYVNNKCSGELSIGLNEFNQRNDFNSYVGYMYGNASSNNYESEHKNINSSSIKIILDSWFQSNLNEYTNRLALDTIYCNNRKLSKYKYNNILFDNIGYGNSISGYELMKNYIDNNISYDCKRDDDRFSVNSKYGNDMLTNPIGLITLEELYYAGYSYNKVNYNNYLSSNVPYWTMSSAYFDGRKAYNFIVNNGILIPSDVSNKLGVRPVITLNKNIIILSGDGSLEKPFILF